jgi:hypothetical protein
VGHAGLRQYIAIETPQATGATRSRKTEREALQPPRDRGRSESQGCKAMTETIIVRGAYAITDPGLGASGVIPAGAVVIVDGTIRETGPFCRNRTQISRVPASSATALSC